MRNLWLHKRYDNFFFLPFSYCFWIRDPGSWMGKNQDPGLTSRIRNTGFVTYMTLPLKNYVHVGSKSYKQKNLEINVVVILKVTDENNNRTRSRIHIRIRKSEVQIRGYGSVPNVMDP